MNPVLLYRHAVIPALALLPLKMDTLRARAMLMAIGFQESRFEFRFQIGGSARGYWQFERMGGCAGVLTHPATTPHIQKALGDLDFAQNSDATMLHNLIGYHDILAAVSARLLLWSSPIQLPSASQMLEGWNYYLECWRPGKPRWESWEEQYRRAWELVSS